MTHALLAATNSLQAQNNVVPRDGTGAKVEGTVLRVRLPTYSYQMRA